MGYFDRGASAGGEDNGYFNRPNITGPEGVGSATGGPGGVADDDLEVDANNPNIVRATKSGTKQLDETAGSTSTARQEAYEQGDPGIVEGSDSERTGTSYGTPGYTDARTVETPNGPAAEGDEKGQANPNRNVASQPDKDDLENVGSWSTIQNNDSAGSPMGFS